MKRGHKLVAALSALCVGACLLVGCASNNYTPSLPEPSLKTPTIGEADTLRVGVNTSTPPLAGMGSDKIIGIDVDIAAALADNLGLKLSVVDVGSNPTNALEENEVDIVMGIDADQKYEGVWLSEVYLPTGIALFSMDERAPLPEAGKGVKFAASSASRSAQAVTSEFGEDSLTQTQTLADAFGDLEAGIVDYVAADAVIGMYSAHTENIDAYIVGLLKAPTGYEIAVNQANGILRDTIEDEIKTLTDDGIIDLIEKKWLDAVVDLEGLPQTSGKPLVTEPETTEEPTEPGEGAVGDASTGATDESTDTSDGTTSAGAGAVSGSTSSSTGTSSSSTSTSSSTTDSDEDTA